MEISLSLSEFRESLAALNNIKSQDLDFELSYKLAKVINKIKPSVKVYEEVVSDFLKENATLDKNTNQYKIKKESLEKFENFKEKEKILLNEVYKVKLDLIPVGLFKDTKISADTLTKIMWLIEGDL